jgi:hypothetical protein
MRTSILDGVLCTACFRTFESFDSKLFCYFKSFYSSFFVDLFYFFLKCFEFLSFVFEALDAYLF